MLRRPILPAFAISILLISCQTMTTVTDAERAAETALRARESSSNGIGVGMPKVYDDSLLQKMLSDAEARLATLQVIDQAGVTARIGGLAGGRQSISSFSFNALGAPAPGVTTTSNAATQTTVQGATTGNTPTTSTTTTSAIPVENVVTTAPQFAATIPTPPAASTTLPSTFGPSASDVLSEQLQLTYEIANLRLLLDGALNDRFLNDREGRIFSKPRVTVGFPITLAPDRRFRNAVAIVEVEVETISANDLSGGSERPGIAALLPREKTYNVAAITDQSMSIGAGVVTQVAAVSGSFLRGQKTFYIVKDQDTVATTFAPSTPARTGFAWQFRPVLGQPAVQTGLKQTFAQLVFPTPKSANEFATVHVRSYWRKYDRKRGTLGQIVAGSVREAGAIPIPRFDLKPNVQFTFQDVEDLGNGQVLVHLNGEFLPGTRVRVGNTILQNGAGVVADPSGIRFAVSLADVATKAITVVARSGEERPLLASVCDDDSCDLEPYKLAVAKHSITPVDEVNSLLRVELEPFKKINGHPPVVVVGGKVFGYSDAPVMRDRYTISAIVPTNLVLGSREISIRPLFIDDRVGTKVSSLTAEDSSDRLVLLSQGDNLRYILFGRNLSDDIKILEPATGARLDRLGAGSPTNMRLLEIPAAAVKTLKHIVFQRPNERPFLVAIPPLQAPEPKPAPKFRERIVVGADDAVVVGEGLNTFVKFVALGKEFKDSALTPSADGKSLRITGLASAGLTSIARTIDGSLVTEAGGKNSIQLEIVNSKVESIPNPK